MGISDSLRPGLIRVALMLRAGVSTLGIYRSKNRPAKITLQLSDTEGGHAIRQHLNSRTLWRRKASALAVLVLPDNHAEYLRGKHRQALRTNAARANRLGFSTRKITAEQLRTITADLVAQGRQFEWLNLLMAQPIIDGMEHWVAENSRGEVVTIAQLQVDGQVAWIRYFVSSTDTRNSGIRYKLSSDIFSYLIDAGVRYAIAGSVNDTRPGINYYLERLGFERMRVVQV